MWGTVPLAARIALDGIEPTSLSSARLIVAGVILALLRRGRVRSLFVPPSPLVFVAALGLAGNYVLYLEGIERTGAATAHLVLQLAPIFFAVLGVIVLRERLTAPQVGGTLLAFGGVLLVAWGGSGVDGATLEGILLLVASALSWSVFALCQKVVGEHHDSGRTILWVFLCGGVALVPLAVLDGAPRMDGIQLLAVVYLCLCALVGYWALAEALRHLEAWVASVIATLGPVVTMALVGVANGVDHPRLPPEPLGVWKLVGALLVICGLCAVTVLRPGSQGSGSGPGSRLGD